MKLCLLIWLPYCTLFLKQIYTAMDCDIYYSFVGYFYVVFGWGRIEWNGKEWRGFLKNTYYRKSLCKKTFSILQKYDFPEKIAKIQIF